ncbi:uncharacterized protein F4822DRAFT_427453 [Hypoxylon trugodes]|uniref:uncharacterized protein n=1 Tax=Hypoxylon trugodes TaxID=326681 RepID=UPI0021A0B6B3|nr:uncharacterized protein F4822DRAFT_427453 [Hypoxylon trugodes]KAI1391599.1 hypothetical protein F4822DRAFT_427453 [Hypoxylon trugodes]
MRDRDILLGRVYCFKKPVDWKQGEKIKNGLLHRLPKIVRMHRVVVVGTVMLDWVKVATITKTIDKNFDHNLYIPIHPMRKNNATNMQLQLARDSFGNNGLTYPSYLKIHELHTVPRGILKEEPWRLKKSSVGSLRSFINRMGLDAGAASTLGVGVLSDELKDLIPLDLLLRSFEYLRS